MKKTAVFAGLMAIGISATVLVGTQNLSLQQALNQLAGNNRAPYTALSAQQAANIMLLQEQQAAEHTVNMPGVLVMCFDDNYKELSPNHDSLYVNSMTNNGIVGGLTIEMQAITQNDTVNNVLSIWDVQALKNRGWELGTTGYDEIAGMYDPNTGLIATGAIASEDTFSANIARGIRAQRDSTYQGIGPLGMPRYAVSSYSSSSNVIDRALALNGIEYQFTGAGTATGANAYDGVSMAGSRPTGLLAASLANMGMFGTGSTVNQPLAAVRGIHGPRYQIVNQLYDGATFASWKKALDRAVQQGGLVVYVGHKPSDIGTAVALKAGKAESFDSLCTYINERYLSTGKLLCLKPSEGLDYFFKRPVGPLVNFASPDFQDFDGDGHVDGWYNGTVGANSNSFAASDSAYLIPHAATYMGHQSMALNWGRAFTQNFPINGNGTYSGSRSGSNWSPLNGINFTVSESNDQIWWQTNAMLCVIPPEGDGWTARFEAWAIIDTTAGGGVASIAGDTLGVTFYAPYQFVAPNYLGTAPAYKFMQAHVAAGTFYRGPDVSWDYVNATTSMPQSGYHFWRLGARNNLYRSGKEWAHMLAEWDVPAYSNYLIVSLCKSRLLPQGSVVISNYSVTFSRRDGQLPKFIASEN